MAKLGEFEIPEITLNKCLEACSVINMQKTHAIGRIAFSELLQMSSRGGQFSKLINSCKNWGVIEGRDLYSLTELGINALNPLNSTDLISKKRNLILNVPFYSALFLNYPNLNSADTTLLQTIEEISGVDRFVSIKFENIIRRVLSEIVPIIQSLDNTVEFLQPQIAENNNSLNITSPGINIDFPFSDDGINAAISLLNSLKISKKTN